MGRWDTNIINKGANSLNKDKDNSKDNSKNNTMDNNYNNANEPENYLQPFFEAKSLVIIGVSENLGKPGGRPLKALLQAGYSGDIYLVNPKYKEIENIKCYPSVLDIPAPIDLAIIVVSAENTLEAVKQCAAKGIKGAVIFTSGFSEVNHRGRAAEEEMVAIARQGNMRLLGPNCLGMINNLTGLWASFAQIQKYREHSYTHRFSLISQSGFFGAFAYQVAGQMKLGFDYFASVGNQADLSFTDFFTYIVKDPRARIIAGYIEGLKEGQGPAFLDAAREARKKDRPVIIMKVGRTEAGARAASSHTGSMAGEDSIYEAAFRQTGVIRADGLEQLMAVLTLTGAGRWPKGKRVAIISASGGGAVILADKCSQMGLDVTELSEHTRNALDEVLPFFASSSNPVDLTAQVITQRDLLYRCLRIVEQDPNVDLLMVSFQLGQDLFESISGQISELYGHLSKPFVLVGHPFGDPAVINVQLDRLRSAGIPVIEGNNNGVWAVSALADWVTSREDILGNCSSLSAGTGGNNDHDDDTDNDTDARADNHHNPVATDARNLSMNILQQSKSRAEEHLSEHSAGAILRAYGINTPKGALAATSDAFTASPEDIVALAEEIGYPVALKIQSPHITHKTDLGGVALNLKTADEVRVASSKMISVIEPLKEHKKIEGILVQEMLKPATEIIIGMKRDKVFGPVIMFGLGGIYVEVNEDIAFRIAPLSPIDALNMIRETRGYRILKGLRGAPPADIDAIIDTLLKVSRLAIELETITEMDINPLFVYPSGQNKGAIAADALLKQN